MGRFPGQSSESAGSSEARYSRSRCCKSEIAMVPGAETDTHCMVAAPKQTRIASTSQFTSPLAGWVVASSWLKPPFCTLLLKKRCGNKYAIMIVARNRTSLKS